MMTISDDDFETADRTRLNRECIDLREQLAAMTKRAEAAEQAYAELANDRTVAYTHLADLEQERDALRKALGSRGDTNCSKCHGRGYILEEHGIALGGMKGYRDVECDCRKRLGLTT